MLASRRLAPSERGNAAQRSMTRSVCIGIARRACVSVALRFGIERALAKGDAPQDGRLPPVASACARTFAPIAPGDRLRQPLDITTQCMIGPSTRRFVNSGGPSQIGPGLINPLSLLTPDPHGPVHPGPVDVASPEWLPWQS